MVSAGPGGARHPLSCLPSLRFAAGEAGLTGMHFSADSTSALLSQSIKAPDGLSKCSGAEELVDLPVLFSHVCHRHIIH